MNKGSNKGSKAAEMTDNALQQLLNKGDERKKILFAHHLKGKCNYLSANQHLAITSCAWPCWTGNHGNFLSLSLSLVEHSLVIQKKSLYMCTGMNDKQERFSMAFSHQGTLETILPWLLWLTIVRPNNKYAGRMKHNPPRRPDKYVKMTVFVFFSFGICYDSLHK